MGTAKSPSQETGGCDVGSVGVVIRALLLLGRSIRDRRTFPVDETDGPTFPYMHAVAAGRGQGQGPTNGGDISETGPTLTAREFRTAHDMPIR